LVGRAAAALSAIAFFAAALNARCCGLVPVNHRCNVASLTPADAAATFRKLPARSARRM
jgi:hypothetical protein